MLDLRSIQINFIHSGLSTPLLPPGGTSISEKRRGEKRRKTGVAPRGKSLNALHRTKGKLHSPRKKIDSNVLERGARFDGGEEGEGGGIHSREVERTKKGRKRQGSRGCVEEGCKAGQRSVRRGSASEHKRNF